MGARWYDPFIGRFTQPDTIVPGMQNPKTWDRFHYSLNNPLRYRDPSGHKACDGDKEDDCEGVGPFHGLSHGERYFFLKDWKRFRKYYGISFTGSGWTYYQKYAVYEAVVRVSVSLSNKSGANDTPGSIFRSIYGSLEFEKKKSNPGYWGWATSYDHINIYSGTDWGSEHIVQFFIHEMGHAFAQSMRDNYSRGEYNQAPYGALAKIYSNDLTFPEKPDGFAGGFEEWYWSELSGRKDGQAGISNEFADMFIGWVFGAWAATQAGSDRAGWIDSNMSTWLFWIYR
jgi:hypothetical protein